MLERVAEGDGKRWIEILNDITDGAITGTVVTAPDVGRAGGETLELGNTTIQVRFKGKAHPDNDLLDQPSISASRARLVLSGRFEMGRSVCHHTYRNPNRPRLTQHGFGRVGWARDPLTVQ